MLDERTVDPDPVLAPLAAWPYSNNAPAWEALLGDARGAPGVPATVAPARLDDHTGLAPAYLYVGALDIFREVSVAYARRLRTAGVGAELHVLPGLVHGWDHLAPRSDADHGVGRVTVLVGRIDAVLRSREGGRVLAAEHRLGGLRPRGGGGDAGDLLDRLDVCRAFQRQFAGAKVTWARRRAATDGPVTARSPGRPVVLLLEGVPYG